MVININSCAASQLHSIKVLFYLFLCMVNKKTVSDTYVENKTEISIFCRSISTIRLCPEKKSGEEEAQEESHECL